MRYDPAMQAAVGDAQGWALLALVLAAFLLVSVLMVSGGLLVGRAGGSDRRALMLASHPALAQR
jgi:hypothetical protein